MIRGQSPARHMVMLAIAAITLSTALVAGIEAQREWRDYAGGPESSRFVAAKQITADNGDGNRCSLQTFGATLRRDDDLLNGSARHRRA